MIVVNDLVAGGAVALMAFGLAVIWDFAKFRRERHARRLAALTGFVEEMSANYDAAENNLTLLAVERRDIAAGKIKGLLNSLSPLEVGAWSIARLDLPRELLADHDLVRRFQIISRNSTDINGLIQSRENFRIQHLSDEAGVLTEGLVKYADILIHLLRDLKQRIAEAEREIVPYLQGSEGAGPAIRLVVTIERRT